MEHQEKKIGVMPAVNDYTNTTGLYGDSRAAPYDMDREDREKLLLDKMTIPSSYVRNTTKEELCLAFVETFRAQYIALYPSRAPLLLSPLNECGRPKFISTFIRATGLRYDELYDYSSCASFVANYIRYEPLDPPESLPSKVMSPSTTLLWQVGNSIEMATLLCSLLLGSGYNAYVVVGYAAREVCNNEQDKQPWPDKLPIEPNLDDEGEEKSERQTRYKQHLKDRPKLRSEYDERVQNQVAKKDLGTDDLGPDPYESRRREDDEEEGSKPIHAWVLLLPKKRKVAAPIFIEPATGMSVPLNDKRYFGIEAIFNHQNYFVNMHAQTAIEELSLDLRDLSCWEHVFLSDPDSALAEDDPSEMERLRTEDLTSDIGESGDQTLDLPASWVSALTLSRAQYENRYPGRRKKITYADAKVEYFADFADAEGRVMEVRLHDEKSSVHGAEQVHTLYRHRADRLRRRSVYPSLERAQAAPRETHDWFEPGRKRERVEGLLEHVVVPGKHRTMLFDWKARDDGLFKRVETFFSEKDPYPKKIQEYYKGRDEDRLMYRSATYEPPKETATMGMHLQTAASQSDTTRIPIKMAEKFERNPKVPADEDIAKRTFIKPGSSDGEIWVIYQYSTNCITRPSRLFPKNAEKEKDTASGGGGVEANPKVVTMPFTEPPKESDLQEQLRVLLLKERECLTEIRNRQQEIKDLLTNLKEQQQSLDYLLSVYDTLRNRQKETQAELEQQRAEELRKAESRKDYLAPYIANLDIGKVPRGDYTNIRLTAEQAKKVRDDALRDLKERLIQRGHIMQNRMDREKEELNRRQTAYQKNLDSNDNAKDSEEFAQFCKEATWRMKILDERLSRHIEQASEKYSKLAHKLSEDPRLRLIYPQQ